MSIKLVEKSKGKGKSFKSLDQGDTFRITSQFSYDRDNIYMKTWEGFACIIGMDLGSTWTGAYDEYRITEVKLEAKEL
jgi:hypothetical protein